MILRKGLFLRLGQDRRGVAATEFALVAPFLIAFYFGMTEFCQGFMAQKRMGHAAAMLADLVAQEESVATTTLDDFFEMGGLIMRPFSAGSLKQRVTSVTRTSGVATVDWSRGDGMTKLAPGTVVTLPADLIVDGESVVMTEASYDYDSPVDYLIPTVTQFSHTYYLRPRTVNKTLCPGC